MNDLDSDWEPRIAAAYDRIRATIVETPLELTTDVVPEVEGNVAFKLEHEQCTGSFKLRGAANKVSVLTREQAKAGVTTSSMGNHGLSVAFAARAAGVPAEVYVGPQVSSAKLDRIRGYGAELFVVGANALEAERVARRAAEDAGTVYISPYNDLDVIAGQGTIGHELVRQLPRVDAVFIAVGGGGLIGGIGAYLKACSPATRIVGCWPENSPVLYECLKHGRIFDVPERPTLSESTAGGIEPDSVTFELARRVIDRSVLVSEDEILAAMRRLRDRRGWIIEGAAGVALAGLLKRADEFAGQTVVVVLCGGNLSPWVRERLQ